MKTRLLVWPLLALVVVSCGKKTDNEAPVATPAVSLAPKAALGSPVEVTYKFTVAQNARFDEDYRIFTHFLGADDELMWTDDHFPPVPTRQWKPGQVVQYTRTVFIPIYPYVGPASIEIGLFSPKTSKRLPLAGQTRGQRAYQVAKVQLLPQTENVFLVYKEGWHSTEVAQDNTMVEWQWTKREATIVFRNPKKNATFFLHFDAPSFGVTGPQTLTIKAGDQVLDTVAIASKEEQIRRVALTPAQMGNGDMVELRLVVDPTFVPALLKAANSGDKRELGVRVFHAFVEPQK